MTHQKERAVRSKGNNDYSSKELLFLAPSRRKSRHVAIPGLHLLVSLIFVFTLIPFCIDRYSMHSKTTTTSITLRRRQGSSSTSNSMQEETTKKQHSIANHSALEYAHHLDPDFPLIHIVNTRFQQHVHNLTALAAARLELFETFCLPSMIHQTLQVASTKKSTSKQRYYRFLWIIKIDPNLNASFTNQLTKLLEPYPNFYLVGSNHNFGASYGRGIAPGSWRSGHAGEDALYGNASIPDNKRYQIPLSTNTSKQPHVIYTGDKSLLQSAHSLRAEKIVLETRLDADDGLPLDYLQQIQTSAIEKLSSTSDDKNNSMSIDNTKARWMYWCLTDSISWHPTVMFNGFFDSPDEHITPYPENDPGRFHLESTDGYVCITPGLTSGISVGAHDSDVPRYSHFDLLRELLKNDGDSKNNCLAVNQENNESHPNCVQIIQSSTTVKAALRARTPTSAGMNNVVIPHKKSLRVHKGQWEFVESEFGIKKERAILVNRYLYIHLKEILLENLMGQCTHGHSCKSYVKHLLEHMIDVYSSSNIKRKNAKQK